MYTILYVDDELPLLEISKLFLELSGLFLVDTISSAPAALDLMNTKTYDAVISDYQMTEMNGIEFLKRVRASGNTTPFILFTGRGREDVVIEAINSGADFYLQKGGEPKSQFAELEHKVRQAVEKHQAEASIRNLERQRADIINFLPDATFAINTDGVVIEWNHAMEEMTGIPSAEMLGKGDYEYAKPFYHERRPMIIDLVLRDDPATEARYAHIMREGKKLTAETTIPHMNDGKGASLWFTASPLYNSSGAIVGAIESIRDISSRKEVESALNKSEERYRLLVEQSPDAVIVHAAGRIVYANPASVSILGAKSSEDIVGRPVLDFVLEDFREIVSERIRVMTDEKQQVNLLEEKFLRLDGTPIDVDVAAMPVTYHDMPSVQVAFRDVTARKKAVAALHESEEKIRASEMFLRTVINGAKEGIIVYDRELRITLWNRFMEEMTGLKAAEVQGKKALELFPFHKETGNDHLMMQALEGITAESSDFEFIIPSTGKKGWAKSIFSPNYDIQGTIIGAIGIVRDITVRKKIETALQASEQKYRNVIDDQTEFISRFLPDGTHIFVNEAYCRYFGLKHNEILGHRFQPNIPPEDQQRVKQFFKSLTPAHPVGTIDHRIIMPDGRIQWQRWSDRAIFDPSGKITEYQSVGRDITEEKATENALRESEQQLRTIFNATPVGIIIVDAKTHTILQGNPKARELIGASESEITGKVCHTFLCPSEEGKCPVSDLGQDVNSSERILITMDGSLVPVIKTVVPAQLGDKKVFVESFIDITDRKSAEKALRESEIRFREQYQNNPLATFIWQHREGDFVLVGCNKAAETLTRGRSQAFLGRTASDLYAARPEIVSEIRQCFFDRTVISRDLVSEHFLPGGRIHTTTAFIPPDLVMVHMEDIIERKMAEEALCEANKKLNLLYDITRHDINNQILALNSFIELLYEKSPDPALEYYFSWITQTVNRISAMIQFTKEYATIGITTPLWQDTRTLVDTAAKQIHLGNVTVKNDLPAGTEVFVDSMIIRVFYNLMDNAVRYGGKITAIRFFWEEQNGNGILVCEDDGTGIQYADKERIFERGFGKNTGIGLFLAREILSITGITIRETGEPGKGTRFEIIFPPDAYRLSHVR
ncbi:MAG: PAS domain S-box protein [Methanoregula sp.]|uniref:PAS domain S-box protein n=1 Tax=Methanoregula sp. TaxID=2052170 RepID=UPI003BB1D35C